MPDYLMHYGVRGMKKGVRKSVEFVGRDARSNMDTRRLSGEEKAKRLVTVGKRGAKLSKRGFDAFTKYMKNAEKRNTQKTNELRAELARQKKEREKYKNSRKNKKK